jgi:L-alanine-DL-glutamate epimerase-like enolase superfamily enzyme
VKITNTKLRPYSIPLKEKWLSHSHSSDTRQGYLLQIEDTLGNIGYGDCAPLPSHGTETTAEALKSLKQQLPSISGLLATDALNRLPKRDSCPATRCAIETALLDLIAKQEAKPLYKWLNPKSSPMVKANANVGALNQDARERIDIAIRQGYTILKLKVGLFKPEEELKLLNQICTDLPSDIQLRLDANQAWDTKTAKTL